MSDHTETVQLDFDPTKISYEALVEAFFDLHDATRSSPSRQYMSVIFVADAEQERVAHAVKERVQSRTRGALKTKILPAGRFYMAEDYHQKYALQSNARFFREFEAMYPDFWELVDSPAATRVNAYLYGFGGAEQLATELDGLGLSEESRQALAKVRSVVACPLG